MGTLISAPSAACAGETRATCTRSSPSRRKSGCSFRRMRTYRSPVGPLRIPASPSPATRSCCPSSMPAGIVSVISRSRRSRPSPRQRVQSLSTVLPAPPQRGQVETFTNRPNTDCWTCRTSPRPPHVPQVEIAEPGSAPEPRQRSQISSRGTVITRSRPCTASRRSISISIRRSAPRIGPRGSRRRRSPPKKVSKRSPMPKSLKPPVAVPNMS